MFYRNFLSLNVLENRFFFFDKHIVCQNCGSIHSQQQVNEFIDFYQNRHRFYKKSIYIRKYHLLNTIDILRNKHHVDIDLKTRDKILRVFKIIEPVMAQLNQDRKRMICTKYIFMNLLKFMKMDYPKIPISESKKTLKNYQHYWNKIIDLKGSEIKKDLTPIKIPCCIFSQI